MGSVQDGPIWTVGAEKGEGARTPPWAAKVVLLQSGQPITMNSSQSVDPAPNTGATQEASNDITSTPTGTRATAAPMQFSHPHSEPESRPAETAMPDKPERTALFSEPPNPGPSGHRVD